MDLGDETILRSNDFVLTKIFILLIQPCLFGM